jgi:hypothetical protein
VRPEGFEPPTRGLEVPTGQSAGSRPTRWRSSDPRLRPAGPARSGRLELAGCQRECHTRSFGNRPRHHHDGAGRRHAGPRTCVPASRSGMTGPVELVVTTFFTPSSGACGRRTSAPSSPPRTGRTGSPQPTTRRSTAPPRPPHTCLPSHGMVKRRGGEWWIGLALRAPRPGTLRPDADRPISAARSKS